MLINYNTFSGATGLALNGNASLNGGALQLTPDASLQRGSAFWNTPLSLSGNASFSTNFQLQITGSRGTNGADGMTFMLQNSSQGIAALGGVGGQLGYGTIDKSLAIKFDTWANTGEASRNYVGVVLNGASVGGVVGTEAPVDLNGGKAVNVWIDYDGQTDKLAVFIAGDTATSKPTNPLFTYTVDLLNLLGTQAYAGFSAGTGGATNAHRINRWQLDTSLPTVPNPTPGTSGSFNYNDFSTLTGIKTNGSTFQSGNVLRLTSDQQLQAGTAFTTTPIDIYGNTSFSTNFRLRFSGVRGTNGGDGMTFLLQNSSAGANAVGVAGGSLGYSGINDSLAIKFDTWQGSGELSNNYVAVLTNGDSTTTYNWTDQNYVTYRAQAQAPFDLNGSGTILNAWVDYNGVTDSLQVYLSNTSTKPTTALISTKIQLSNVVGSQAFVGFSGATGGATSIQDVLNWSFSSSTPAPPAPQPGVARILALGDSITLGVTARTDDKNRTAIPGGYRRVLWNKFVNAGIAVDFVGSETDGTSTNPAYQWTNGGDKNDQGMSGWRIEKIIANVENYLKREKPDIITLMIGTNNLFTDTSGAQMLSRLNTLINKITAFSPNTKLLVGSIPPAYPDIDRFATPERSQQQMQMITDYNNGIPGLISNARAAGKKVYFVDMRSLTVSDLAPRSDDNGLHPSMAGYDKIGTLWYNALLDPNVVGVNGNTLKVA
ncbi:GDSL-type esterase/lipase family protein [Leptolyngbya sp. DQ-M1]|uniref:lectin-like domain-containing protein n=1 Tax=Leptolyngbya sp. DQ-M1 TaxID=2933920 RepID=UPI0032990BF1